MSEFGVGDTVRYEREGIVTKTAHNGSYVYMGGDERMYHENDLILVKKAEPKPPRIGAIFAMKDKAEYNRNSRWLHLGDFKFAFYSRGLDKSAEPMGNSLDKFSMSLLKEVNE